MSTFMHTSSHSHLARNLDEYPRRECKPGIKSSTLNNLDRWWPNSCRLFATNIMILFSTCCQHPLCVNPSPFLFFYQTNSLPVRSMIEFCSSDLSGVQIASKPYRWNYTLKYNQISQYGATCNITLSSPPPPSTKKLPLIFHPIGRHFFEHETVNLRAINLRNGDWPRDRFDLSAVKR